MIETRIITVMQPPALPGENPPCSEHTHSKYVRRRKYAFETLMPQIENLGFFTAIFQAVVKTDFEFSGHTLYDGGKAVYKDLTLDFEYGVVGCFLSHVMLWRLCVEKDVTLFVIEDDARLPKEHEDVVVNALREYDARQDSGDILYLLSQLPYSEVGLHDYPANTLTCTGTLRRVFPVHDLAGTAAYAIRPNAAKKLLDFMTKIRLPAVDGFLHRAVNEREIGLLLPENFKQTFMLYEHFAPWNHVHEQSVSVGASQ